MTESAQPPSNASADLDAIVAALDVPFSVLPEEAIQSARQHKQAMIPRLVALIEQATRTVQAGEEVNRNGHFFAFFLLAEFRAFEALPAIMNALTLPDEGPFDLFGDAIHETVPGVLAALAGDNDHRFDQVASLIDNAALNEYVRWSAANGLAAMVAAGIRPRDQIVQRLRRSLSRAIDARDASIVTGLVCTLNDLYPQEASEEIKEAYAKDLVDESVISPKSIKRTLANDRTAHLEQLADRHPLFSDTVEKLRHWAAFSGEEKEAEPDDQPMGTIPPQLHRALPAEPEYYAPSAPNPIHRADPRVGRNDSCPCGSGKKFKKCCGQRT
jgi:hypothetical protein